MPKRKRQEDVGEVLSRSRRSLSAALKLVKGFERQRLAKRLKDPKSTPAKVERLQKEVLVLKVGPLAR